MLVTEAIGRALTELGVDTAFGLVGSGNFHVTNALISRGTRFIAARHESGAASMADGWARITGRPGVLSLHQGPGITNALTALTEAAKSRTPLLVLAADVSHTAKHSNFRIDVAAISAGIGATPARLHSAGFAVDDVVRAYRTAERERRCVILAMPLDVQAGECTWPGVAGLAEAPGGGGSAAAGPGTLSGGAWALATGAGAAGALATGAGAAGALAAGAGAAGAGALATGAGLGAAPPAGQVAALARRLAAAERPVFIAGRGARAAGPAALAELERLAEACGALLATSAAAKGLFHGRPWNLDVSGGFATPLAAELIRGADLVVGWGCSLNMWTLRSGALIGPGAAVVQVDHDAAAIGAHRRADLGVTGSVGATARAVADALSADALTAGDLTAGDLTAGARAGYRSDEVRARIASAGRWRDVPFTDESYGGRIDPRALTIALDDLLPAERIVAVDSGNFMGYPSMYLSVPDQDGFTFTQAFQSIGLGLASAIGSAIARPDRLTVAALGDGGALMGVSELETAVRLGLPMVIVVYNDDAYGAEVHHFGPDGHPLETVMFPPTDIAAIARGFGCAGVTVRGPGDLGPVRAWLDGSRDRPLLIDAKVTANHGSWWLEEAFRGH
ncbi:MAG TPA: thiamine pyrophosphate-binding protein [Streptosporangiaceae bacterium]|nr:thiamine pyrophosphate-binding protein [Streptosporangiaceae bacterium]